MPSSPPRASVTILERVLIWVCALIIGGCAGALAGSFVARSMGDASPALTATSTSPTASSTPSLPSTSTPPISVVPLERRSVAPLLPPAFVSRRTSAVASLYRKPKGTTFEERLLGTERLLGEATALTSDGWFVTSAASIGSLHLVDLVLWYDGVPYAIEKGVADSLNDTVYLKAEVSGITPSAFARVSDLTSGSELWIETRPQEFAPSLVVNVRGRVSANASASSEEATRRILISGTSLAGDQGSPVWDPNGSLVGIIESGAGERVRLVPASTIASSFTSLLATGDIRHAALGVQVWDAAAVRSDVSRSTIPRIGAWVKDEKGKNYAKLKTGDVILRVEHDILDGTVDLGEVLAEYRPGTSVSLRILRDGKDMDVSVMLGTMVTSQALK